MSGKLVKQYASVEEKKLEEGLKAGEALVKHVASVEKEDDGCTVDPVTGTRFISSKDLQELLDFDQRVRKQTGVGFFDWGALRDMAYTSYYKALDEKKKAS